jgi:hypothetical protein
MQAFLESTQDILETHDSVGRGRRVIDQHRTDMHRCVVHFPVKEHRILSAELLHDRLLFCVEALSGIPHKGNRNTTTDTRKISVVNGWQPSYPATPKLARRAHQSLRNSP